MEQECTHVTSKVLELEHSEWVDGILASQAAIRQQEGRDFCPLCGGETIWDPVTNVFYCKDCPIALEEGELVVKSSSPEIDSSKNNGGDTDYYEIKKKWVTAQDVIEARKMNFAQGNIFKASFTFNCGRHEASTYERELNKIIWFANREKERIKNEL